MHEVCLQKNRNICWKLFKTNKQGTCNKIIWKDQRKHAWNETIYIYFASITIALLLLLVVIVAGGVVSGGFVGNKKNQNISIFDWCYSQEN